MWAHFALFSCADQDGELAAIDCVIFRADRDPVRDVEESPQPADGSRMFARPIQKMHP